MSLMFALQALLTRHESYVADAEEDRRRMELKVECLEREKRELEGRNKETVEENRRLLDQLESLNTACAESEMKVLSMTELLRSTDQELERLNGLVARTEGLQLQLARLEDEQASLHATLAITKEEEHAVLLQWQKAERTILSLQDQIDKIEFDAREERERHTELIARMDRRRAVEAELRNSRSQLDSAKKRKSQQPDDNGGNVVSHFVKDILQDNANLQLGIVELKEMLDRSNEEVERLRQVMEQPDLASPLTTPTQNLGSELNTKELHVHHHYHAPTTAAAQSTKPLRPQIARRARKKRTGLTSGSSSGYTTPRSSISAIHSPARGSAASAILSQTSVTIPQQRSQRWSIQSSQTGYTNSSSLPSSPYTDSVFDRVFSDIGTDLSHPTSPESGGVLSPFASSALGNADYQRSDSIPRLSLDGSMRTVSESTVPLAQQLSKTVKANNKGKVKRESFTPDFDAWQAGHSIILEEDEDLDVFCKDATKQEASTEDSEYSPLKAFAPKLRRAASHESLMSVSGMDIHTLQSRPSQLLAGHRLLSASPATGSSSQAVLSGTSATAIRPTLSRFDNDSRSYLSGIAANQRKPMAKKASVGNLGQRVGGWVRGRWGYAPDDAATVLPKTAITVANAVAKPDTVSTHSLPKSVRSISSSVVSADGSIPDSPRKPSLVMRPPGINQSGPIFGFAPEARVAKRVVSTGVDVAALRECLENG
ncbi:hypothetical protein EJ08DRAFT_296647 [Tothia fuscella]|uniref:Uncharacterized protein n=1 Tax=Tothia fuscella TaxID=1048955 RepID=A0A9P4P3K4_9PEZI|nr:hypothetical protein EJ08DRAFT_296647 [Tothia fuscella]